jgi:hypothetical protein
VSGGHSPRLRPDHRARAAALAISRRRVALNVAARAGPPFNPPKRPSAAACGLRSTAATRRFSTSSRSVGPRHSEQSAPIGGASNSSSTSLSCSQTRHRRRTRTKAVLVLVLEGTRICPRAAIVVLSSRFSHGNPHLPTEMHQRFSDVERFLLQRSSMLAHSLNVRSSARTWQNHRNTASR